jgi:replication factor C subunit 3/5
METKLPWAERFRPTKISEIVSHDHIKNTFIQYLEHKTFPHLLFYGPSGTGKTSTIKAFAKELYKNQYDLMVLEINASEERGIDVVRSKIKDFVTTRGNFFGKSVSFFKLVILDEADAMTNEAQAMLRRVIETHTDNARFCLICNYRSKIIDAIQSRCTMFKFPPLDAESIKAKIKDVASSQNIDIDESGIQMLIKLSNGDMRKLLNIFQSIAMLEQPITCDFVAEFIGYPGKKDMKHIVNILNGDNLKNNICKLNNYIKTNSFSIQNIITELTDMIYSDIMSDNVDITKMRMLIKELSNIEINMCYSPNPPIQISTLASIYYISNYS